jgi:peptidoglycan/LPS O-acetylase OafA/YrhL
MSFLFLQIIATNANAQLESLCIGTACFLWVIIWFVIAILIAVWVYKDAEKRGSSGALWLIIIILTGIIGIIIWLLIRPPLRGEGREVRDTDNHYCTKCGKPVSPTQDFCPFCGNKLR